MFVHSDVHLDYSRLVNMYGGCTKMSPVIYLPFVCLVGNPKWPEKEEGDLDQISNAPGKRKLVNLERT